MSNGAISVKGIAWKGNLPAFKQQFPAFVQNSGHGQALKFKLLTDVVDKKTILFTIKTVSPKPIPMRHNSTMSSPKEKRKVSFSSFRHSYSPRTMHYGCPSSEKFHSPTLNAAVLGGCDRSICPCFCWATLQDQPGNYQHVSQPTRICD